MKTYPIYVHAENYKDAIEFIYLSYELGGFPLVDIVFDPTSRTDYHQDLHQIFSLQRNLK